MNQLFKMYFSCTKLVEICAGKFPRGLFFSKKAVFPTYVVDLIKTERFRCSDFIIQKVDAENDAIIWFSSRGNVNLHLVHINIEIVIKKGGGIRPYEALATLYP